MQAKKTRFCVSLSFCPVHGLILSMGARKKLGAALKTGGADPNISPISLFLPPPMLYVPRYNSPTALLDKHCLTCGISSLDHYVLTLSVNRNSVPSPSPNSDHFQRHPLRVGPATGVCWRRLGWGWEHGTVLCDHQRCLTTEWRKRPSPVCIYRR